MKMERIENMSRIFPVRRSVLNSLSNSSSIQVYSKGYSDTIWAKLEKVDMGSPT